MIAVLSWLKKHRKNADIFLVCSGKEDDSEKRYALSELSKERVKELYDNRVLLSSDDIEYADFIWQLYCENNPIRLQKAVANKSNTNLDYLADAVNAHILRFPSVKNGLNFMENRMIDIAYADKPESKEQLVATMLKNQGIYGFGDSQYFHMASRLKPLFRSFNPVKLTNLGKNVMNKVENSYPVLRNENEYLGGTPKYSFLFFEDNAQLLKL